MLTGVEITRTYFDADETDEISFNDSREVSQGEGTCTLHWIENSIRAQTILIQPAITRYPA